MHLWELVSLMRESCAEGLEKTGPTCLRDCSLMTDIGLSFQLDGPPPVGEKW